MSKQLQIDEKEYKMEYEEIVMFILHEYLFFRIFRPKGSIQDFLNTTHYDNCKRILIDEFGERDE